MTATTGTFTIGVTENVSNTISVSVARVKAYQHRWQSVSLACALGWHDGHDHDQRCSAQGFADLLHEVGL